MYLYEDLNEEKVPKTICLDIILSKNKLLLQIKIDTCIKKNLLKSTRHLSV